MIVREAVEDDGSRGYAIPRGTIALGPSGRVPARFEARSSTGGH
ncbi:MULTISPECIES: cytochrome P450 [Sorangium]|nr:cytochrome P450 [Sorangium cellulosum]